MNSKPRIYAGLFYAQLTTAVILVALPTNQHFNMKYLILALLPLLLACSMKKEQPITDAEATAYAKQIDAAARRGNRNIINTVLDEDLFADEVAKAAGKSWNSGLKEGVKKGLVTQNFSRQVFESMGEDGTYEFVRQYQKDGVQHIIFRLFGDGWLNYHDFALAKYNDSIRARDIYLYLSGENLSKTMGALVMAMTKADDNNSIDIKQQAQVLPRIRLLQKQKQFEEAKRLLDGLPAEIRKEKAMQLVNVQLAAEMDEATYTAAMNEFEKSYGNDPTVQLALFDNYFLRGDYDRLFTVLDGIDKTVQDPVLDYFRATVYYKKGDKAAAVQRLEALHRKLPDFQPGALELLANYLEQNQIEKANTLAAGYRANKKFNQERLEQVLELYPDAAAQMRE